MIAITCSGTGGHIYPAVAIAQEKQDKNIIFIIEKGRLAESILPRYQLPYQTIDVARQQKSSFITGFFQAYALLKKQGVTHCISTGGYATIPVVLAAFIKRIPITLYEQNAWPGRSNRVLQWVANKVCVSFEMTRSFFDPKKVKVTGNPIRTTYPVDKKVNKLMTCKWANQSHCLIFGGSQGARAINQFVSAQYNWFIERQISVIHILGPAESIHTETPYPKFIQTKDKKVHVAIIDYVEDMKQLYDWADYVISRSGATSIAELMMFKKPALLIPYPHATDNHQYYNAKAYIEQTGSGVLVDQKDLSVTQLDTFFKQ